MKKLILTSFLLLIFSAFPLNTFAGDSSHCVPPGELGGADYCPGQDYWSGACQDRVTCDSGYSFSCSQGKCCFDNDDGTYNQLTDPINDGTTCSAIHRGFNGCAAPNVCKNSCTSGWEKDPAYAWSSVDACRPKCASYEVRIGDICVFESTLIYSESQFKADTAPGSPYVGVGGGGQWTPIEGGITYNGGKVNINRGLGVGLEIEAEGNIWEFVSWDNVLGNLNIRGPIGSELGLQRDIDDAIVTVGASANNNAKFIVSGNVGIGTDNPGAKLDVVGAIKASTVDTGQGANELYDMNQNVKTTSTVDFAKVNTGLGDNELYDMNQNVKTTSTVDFAKVNTGLGDNELYDMNQNVKTTSTVDFAKVNTGYGDNELYDMNQHVKTTSNVTFNRVGIGESGPDAGLDIKGPGHPHSFIYLDTDAGSQDAGMRLYENGNAKWHIYNQGGTYDNLRIDKDVGNTNGIIRTNSIFRFENHIIIDKELKVYGWCNGPNSCFDDIAEDVHSKNSSENWFCYESNSSEEQLEGKCKFINNFESEFESGDVVCLDKNNPTFIQFCDSDFDNTVLSVINYNSTLILANNAPYPMSLAGNVPVKVICDDPISPGDMLVTASEPGYAKKLNMNNELTIKQVTGTIFAKATEGCSEGRAVIRAWLD